MRPVLVRSTMLPSKEDADGGISGPDSDIKRLLVTTEPTEVFCLVDPFHVVWAVEARSGVWPSRVAGTSDSVSPLHLGAERGVNAALWCKPSDFSSTCACLEAGIGERFL